MRRVIPEKLPRLVLTLLMALGMTIAFGKAVDMALPMTECALICAAVSLSLEAVFLTRRTAVFGGPALLGALLIQALAEPGRTLLTDLLRALTLQFSGVPGALPLMAREAGTVLAAVLAVLSFLCCRPGMGGSGAVLMAAGGLLVLWLADRPELMPWMLPACAAALCLMLMERHPEASFARVFPVCAALTALAWALVPPSGLVIPELKEKADTLRQTVMDRLFFTEPRDVFSLSMEGYYPQGVSQLGGPVSPSDHPVMQVAAPRSVYLRGVIMNEYDGRVWRNTMGGRRYLWESAGMSAQRVLLFDQNLPSESLSGALPEPADISVRMLADRESTLFVPQRVREIRTGGELVPYFTNSSEIFVTRNLLAGDTWTVSATLFQAGDPGLGTLVDAAGEAEDPRWESLTETYTALPSHLEEPVWQMAADVTAGLTSSYEKAFALQNYLSRNYRYTLDVTPQPSSLDFVTNFLFNTREGYCTYFASAMTVLCRMAGLPARYVEGYLAEPDAQGTALVTGLDAHAWTEVYFRGFGWVTFDATPRRARTDSGESAQGTSPTPSVFPGAAETPTPPRAGQDTQESVETASPAPENPEDASLQAATGDSAGAGFPWLLILLALTAAAALGLGIRWILTSPARRERRTEDEGARFDLWMEEVTRCLDAAGKVRSPGETLMSFTRRLDAEAEIPVSLGRLGECASLLRYGRVQAVAADTALARDTAEALKKALAGKARLRYAARRLAGRREPAFSAAHPGRTPR